MPRLARYHGWPFIMLLLAVVCPLPGPPSRVNARSAPPEPSAITRTATLWLQADALALNNDDPVAIWKNSGSGDNLAQSVAGRKPIYKANVINGLPAVRGDGVDDHVSFNPVAGTGTTRYTILAVIKTPSAISADMTVINVGDTDKLFRITAAGKMALLKGATTMGTANSVLSTSTAYMLGLVYDGATVSFYLNGASDGMGSSAQSFTGGGVYVFAEDDAGLNPFGGHIAELIYYAAALDGADLSSEMSYLTSKYALAGPS